MIFAFYNDYPKFRVNAYSTRFNVQIRRALWPFWIAYEDGHYGVDTYNTFEIAQERVYEILRWRLEDIVERKQAKSEITNEALSVKDFIHKYPEEFL